MSTLNRAWNEARRRGEQRRRRMARRLPRWRTRARRRVLVAVWLLVPIALITMSVTLSWTNRTMPLIYVGILVLWYPFWLILRVLTTASAEAVAALLDERELALRNRLSYIAYNVLILANIAVIFYVIANENDPVIAVRTVFLLTPCMLLSGSVPTALLAWRMPDDDPEDLEPATALGHGAEDPEHNTRQGGNRA